MGTSWERIDYGIADKVLSTASFFDEQNRLLSESLQPCERILDLCIGFGSLAKKLVEQGKRVYGVDINSQSLIYVRKKIGVKDNLRLILGDARQLPFGSVFDGASCASSFDFPNLSSAIGEVNKSLKVGGYFSLTGLEDYKSFNEHVFAEFIRKFEEGAITFTSEEIEKAQEFSKQFDIGELEKQVNYRSCNDVATSLTRCGFQILKAKPFYHGVAYFVLAQKT